MVRSLAFCLFLYTVSFAENIEDLYDVTSSSAWILCRKLINGVHGNFGVGYKFSVAYELTNVGSQTATDITISDAWDTQYFKSNSKQNVENITFSQAQLEPSQTVSFSYKLIPVQTASVAPYRANISYAVTGGVEDEDDDEEQEVRVMNGQCSNWVVTVDDMLLFTPELHGEIPSNVQWNRDNNRVIVVSGWRYSRQISSTWFYWILFVLFMLASVAYPLCEYETHKGDFNFIPFGIGAYVRLVARVLNATIVSKIKQKIAEMQKTKKS